MLKNKNGGRRWIRTTEPNREWIYSPHHLTTLLSYLKISSDERHHPLFWRHIVNISIYSSTWDPE